VAPHMEHISSRIFTRGMEEERMEGVARTKRTTAFAPAGKDSSRRDGCRARVGDKGGEL
jgi:hypothetical protein